MMGLPHARVELASCAGKRGVISQDFTDDRRVGQLTLGNELLFERDPTYPKKVRHGASAHTISAICDVLGSVRLPQTELPAWVTDCTGLFAGYLLLDAIVVNVDRHHENWSVLTTSIVEGSQEAVLAPTFDHASSLGRELSDDARHRKYAGKLNSLDVAKYIKRARSAIYDTRDCTAPLSPLEAFQRLAVRRPDPARGWLDRWCAHPTDEIDRMVGRVPSRIMSRPKSSRARSFDALH